MTTRERLGAWLERSLPQDLPAFLAQCRWFGGKAHPIDWVDVEDIGWLEGSGSPCAFVVAGVRFADGRRDRYAMVLAFLPDQSGLPVIGRIEDPDRALWVVEAAADPEAAGALLDGFRAGATPPWPMSRGGALAFGDTTDPLAGPGGGHVSVHAVGAEQSNTSLRVNRSLVFKLFRRLEEGESPELEVGRFLATRTTFRATPQLRGSLTYLPPRGAPTTVGVLQDWIENHGDGWAHVVARLRDGATGQSLDADLRSLGATTAELHAALASDPTSPAFAPEPATPADLERWRQALQTRAEQTWQLIARLPSWPEQVRRLAREVLARQQRVAALVPAAPSPADPRFMRIRIHGDYHLGQTLRTDAGFAVIDFEGEPARPLPERRRKDCALRDVAGMVRSFDYAVAAAGAGDVGPMRRAFLAGYLGAAPLGRTAFLPVDRSTLDTWLSCFEIDKALYEVEYEIDHRPDWVRIPLGGILRLLGGHPPIA